MENITDHGVMLELGLLLGLGKRVVLIIGKAHQKQVGIPSDLAGFYRVLYETHEGLRSELKKILRKYILESPTAT